MDQQGIELAFIISDRNGLYFSYVDGELIRVIDFLPVYCINSHDQITESYWIRLKCLDLPYRRIDLPSEGIGNLICIVDSVSWMNRLRFVRFVLRFQYDISKRPNILLITFILTLFFSTYPTMDDRSMFEQTSNEYFRQSMRMR